MNCKQLLEYSLCAYMISTLKYVLELPCLLTVHVTVVRNTDPHLMRSGLGLTSLSLPVVDRSRLN